ncbi:MAG: siphovirus Gp157 family protein [Pseudomonadota bacterium]
MSGAHALRQRLAEHEALRHQLEEMGLDGQWLDDTLEGETDLDTALLDLAEEVAEREAQALAVKARLDVLRDRKKRIEDGTATIRAAMLVAMERANMPRVKGAIHTLSVRAGAPRATVTDANVLPGEYLIPQPPKVDQAALSRAVKDGLSVPGAVLTNGAPSLTISPKPKLKDD